MNERPIIFNDAMVRAILDGRKTQTRRIVKGLPLAWLDDTGFEPEFVAAPENHLSPFGFPGDRLWVRECFATLAAGSYEQEKPCSGRNQDVRCRATDRLANSDKDVRGYSWRPSIHMPRWASRITLEITGVRVERLQDINVVDAHREGAPNLVGADTIKWFVDMWQSIYGAESWQSNPWVWVVEFQLFEPEASK